MEVVEPVVAEVRIQRNETRLRFPRLTDRARVWASRVWSSNVTAIRGLTNCRRIA